MMFSRVFAMFLSAVPGSSLECTTWAFGMKTGNKTCTKDGDDQKSEKGTKCMATKLASLIATGCDSNMCTKFGDPVCCKMPITDQLLMCLGSGDYTSDPNESSFTVAACSEPCVERINPTGALQCSSFLSLGGTPAAKNGVFGCEKDGFGTDDESKDKTKGVTCMRSKLGDMIVQGCDGGLCADISAATRACCVTAADQVIKCKDSDFSGTPTASDFAENCPKCTSGIPAKASDAVRKAVGVASLLAAVSSKLWM